MADLHAIRNAARAVGDRPGAHRFDDFSIFVGRCAVPMAWQSVRLWAQTLRRHAGLDVRATTAG